MKRRNGRQFKREMKRLIGQSFERLESRYCLTVAAAVTGGNLVISGDADGAVALKEMDATIAELPGLGETNLLTEAAREACGRLGIPFGV